MTIETPDVTVKVSRELLAELGDWSEPVQVKIERYGDEYTMVARRPERPTITDDDIRRELIIRGIRPGTPEGDGALAAARAYRRAEMGA